MPEQDFFEKGLKELEIELNETQLDQFEKYFEYLVEKNKVMNLTAITEREDVYLKHFLDSLGLVKAVDPEKIRKVIDVGTGAGFPGIPLKIAFPQLDVCLMDSLNKRIQFLKETAELLHLDGIEAVHSRAEELARKTGYREGFDVCVSRAVANLSTLCEYCLPFARVGGCFVSYKSGTIQEELDQATKAIKILGGKLEKTVYFKLPGSDIERSMVVIRKVKETPKKYPRKAGTPSKEPLV